MIYVPPQYQYSGNDPSIFLAGGISGCEVWQTNMIDLLAKSELQLINPRRETYVDNPEVAREQIQWEHRHLRLATARMFWFPSATLCPITLFELGVWTTNSQPLFVGMDPNYDRRLDVEMQLGLARPDVTPVYSLEDLANQILLWEKTR